MYNRRNKGRNDKMDWCENCFNTGRIGRDSIITYCSCKYGKKLQQANFQLLYIKSGLPVNLTKLSLEDFLIQRNHRSGDALTPPQTGLKKQAKRVVLEYENQILDALKRKDIFINVGDNKQYSGNNLFFYGGEESGKSMLAVDILKTAIKKTKTSLSAYYIIWDDLLAELIPFSGIWEDLVDKCKNHGILCVDSIGKSDISYDNFSHVKARLNTIFKNRLLQNKPTIFTSNYSPQAFLKDPNSIFNSSIKKSLKIKLDNSCFQDFNTGGGYR